MNRILLIVLLGINTLFAQAEIGKLRNIISEINIGFLNSEFPDKNKLVLLQKTLDLIEAGAEGKFDLSEMKTELSGFKQLIKYEQIVDSLKKAFRSINNIFNSVVHNYFYDKLINSSKQKIIIFSTSMSCECTLEQCYEQETKIQKFCRDNNYEYAVIDSWVDVELQQKYKIDFIPTVLVLDRANSIIERIVRSDNLDIQLIK